MLSWATRTYMQGKHSDRNTYDSQSPSTPLDATNEHGDENMPLAVADFPIKG